MMLARMGVGFIRIADPEVFELTNVNRQYGAYIDTLGRNKAEVISEDIRRINPYISVGVWNYAIDETNVDRFLADKIDVLIDALDFYSLDVQLIMHKKAREKQIWICMSQVVSGVATYMSFNPKRGGTLEEMVTTDGSIQIEKAINSMFPRLPVFEESESIRRRIIKGEKVSIPSTVIAPYITAILVVKDISNSFIKRGQSIAEAPSVLLIDLDTMKIEFYKR